VSASEDKRFESTPSRRERAKREGNIAQSAELSGMAAFGAATLVTMLAVPLGASAVVAVLRDVAAHPHARGAPSALAGVALAALLPAAAAAFAGTAASLLQRGGLHFAGLKAEPKRLDPFAGFKRMAGGETAVAAARAAIAFVAALAAIAPSLRDVVGAGAGLNTPAAAAGLVASAALCACCAALAVGVAFAVADYALARRRWLRGLRMSLHEIKRDAKENEGDPQARARRKGTHRAIVRGAIGRTREASFVVVNPAHVAVALRYAPPSVPVPRARRRGAAGARDRARTRDPDRRGRRAGAFAARRRRERPPDPARNVRRRRAGHRRAGA